jgi:cob(I)alamin adenosyltransferase
MKIYTKKGDTGTTQLIGGTRVPKNELRIEAYGTIDELNSFAGLLRDQHISDQHKKNILEIQDRLFTMGSLLAADPEKSKMKLPELKEEDILFLETAIDKMEATLPEMKSFILPGGHPSVSICHVTRCVCRRAERLVVQLSESNPVDAIVIKYLNRLSDYFFVLARSISAELKAEEIPWKPRMDN